MIAKEKDTHLLTIIVQKKYEIANKKFKPKKTNTIENIILSGILIHVKYFKD
jgi:hypothetical protein